MRRLLVVLCVCAVVAMMVAVYAAPAIAQTKKEARQAAREAQRAANRAQIAAQAGIENPEAIAAKSDSQKAETKDKGGKALPQSGGANIGSLLGLGAGVALVGGGLVAYRRSSRRSD